MGDPNQLKEKEKSNSLEILSDEELAELKQQAIEDEDYDKAKEIKQEQARRKGLEIEMEKDEYKRSRSEKIKDLLAKLSDDKNINISESMEQYFEKICEQFKNKAIEIKGKIDEYNSEDYCCSEDNYYYIKGFDLYNYLKRFCSSYNSSLDKGRNNSEIIKNLGLEESFNNIYRRCLMFSSFFSYKIITGKIYFELMYEMFYDIESTISRSKDELFYMNSNELTHLNRDDRTIPGL